MSVVESSDAPGMSSVTVTWANEHATTATTAAMIVLIRYSAMMSLK